MSELYSAESVDVTTLYHIREIEKDGIQQPACPSTDFECRVEVPFEASLMRVQSEREAAATTAEALQHQTRKSPRVNIIARCCALRRHK